MQASRRRNKKTRQACLPNVSAWYWRLTCSESLWDGQPTQLFLFSVTMQTLNPHKQPWSLVANSCAEDSPEAGTQIAQLPGLAVLTFTSGRHCLHTFTCVCFLRSILIARSSQSAKQAPSLLCAGSNGMYQSLMPDLRATKELKTKQRSSSMGHPAAREGLEFMLGQTEGGEAWVVERSTDFHPQRLKMGLSSLPPNNHNISSQNLDLASLPGRKETLTLSTCYTPMTPSEFQNVETCL